MSDNSHPQRILMVMPYHQLVRKAVEAGFRVWSIWDPSLRDQQYLRQVEEHSEELLLVDFDDQKALRALVAETARENDVVHVLHLGAESSMAAVIEEAEALGLSLNRAESVRLLNDKAAMRELLNKNALSIVRASPAATVAGVREVVGRFATPVIVKPANSVGSTGIGLVRDTSELDAWASHIEACAIPGPYIVEEYLEGPEFSVETLTVNGMHQVVGVTAKQTTGAPGFVETGHIHPAPLSECDRAAVRATATALLDLAGYEFGPAHTEVILTARGPRIVESQARLGGDRIPLLVEIACGYDVEAAIFQALAGRPVAPTPAHRLASIGFFQLPVGVLTSVADLDEVRALPHVHAVHFPFGPGDSLPPTTNSRSRHGYVVVDADSPAQAAERITAAQALLRAEVQTTTAPVPEGAVP